MKNQDTLSLMFLFFTLGSRTSDMCDLKLSTMFLLAVLSGVNAFVLPSVRSAALTHSSLDHATRAAIVLNDQDAISVSPLQGLVIAGGTAGILGAAFCTSTGSPPNGLAVATAAILLMFLGANVVESQE
jgi:hypothetical protein